jgi:hypothetical protein
MFVWSFFSHPAGALRYRGQEASEAMNKLLGMLLTGVMLVMLGSIAEAQFGPSHGRYQPESVAALIERVHVDLDRGYGVWHLRHGDRERLNHSEHQLRDFAKHWERGKFDRGNLDHAIGDIQKVINDNHLSGRERDALWNDVEELRRMRQAYDRHELG